MDEGATIALVAGGLLIVAYFLYQQQEDTQILLAKSLQGTGGKGIVGEIVDVASLGAKIASFI